MAEHVHTVVVGAGVVGLAIARRLAREAGELLIIEREPTIGSGTSARNSEVIHAGMYYAPGTRKARTCVQGRRLLYEYCGSHGVEHRRVGKLIVATEPDHLAQLEVIARRSIANGLDTPDDALQWLDGDAVAAIEPSLRCLAALWSPATGIIDTHGLMLAYQGDAERDGAVLATGTALVGAERDGQGWRVRTRGSDGEFEFACTRLVNAAGLQAQQVAHRIEGLDARFVPAPLWLKGNYFSVAGRQPPFRHLIYPVPSGGGLGVHLTLDLGGQARFGPDTEALDPAAARDDAPDYEVRPERAEVFYAAIRKYWPALPDGALQPAYAGIRPKLEANGTGVDANDFEISGPARHGLPGLVNLYGIESPGITASLALADEVAAALAAG
ncbi:MAG: NAD(P)/FAD-dependent oxidoreductase [Comamonadaceae bacterium]|nr:MAG: NAD(P)/FAD-dependent oxidoreductase [Comamonadaceae bacterium]